MGAPPEESALEALGSTSGAKAQDAEFFATDLAPIGSTGQVNKVTVTLVFATSETLEVTLDSGANFHILLAPADIVLNTFTTVTFFARVGDTINFRVPEVGGVTADVFRVDTQNH